MDHQRLIRILMSLIILGTIITILSEYHPDRTLVYIYKPMTMLFIILLAWLGGRPTGPYRMRIMLGLMFSLAGDIFLMWPDRFFMAGLVSFLVAHLWYITAFSTGRQTSFTPTLTIIPYAILGVIVYVLLLPGLGDLRWPVLVYLAVILTMGWQSVERVKAFPALGWLAPLGAILFIISDTCLAWDKFHTSFSWARVIVLGTYFPAQMLIALTVKREVDVAAESLKES